MTTTTNNDKFITKRPRHLTLAAMGALAGCFLCIISSKLDLDSYNRIDQSQIIPGGHRLLQSQGGVIGNKSAPKRLNSPPIKRAPRAVASQGAGPELTGLDGQIQRFHIEDHPDQRGVTWYKLLASSKLQWNMAAYRWNKCPHGEDVFMGNTGFSFHEPDPQDPTKMLSNYLQFRVQRRDERDCLWNYSKACLAGGSFVMKFGKTESDVFHPGDYSLETSDGVIRTVAYNTNRACSIEMNPDIASAGLSLENTAIDFLRQAKEYTVDPEGCETWIKEREEKDDLFSFNSDLSTVNIHTPWASITIQVRQNKVKTEESCVFASMNVWVTNLSPDLLADEFSGVLGVEKHFNFPPSSSTSNVAIRALSHMDTEQYEVDGPFGI